jgi:hypothetical protein
VRWSSPAAPPALDDTADAMVFDGMLVKRARGLVIARLATARLILVSASGREETGADGS